jgi:hypothetical protein
MNFNSHVAGQLVGILQRTASASAHRSKGGKGKNLLWLEGAVDIIKLILTGQSVYQSASESCLIDQHFTQGDITHFEDPSKASKGF